MPLGPAATLCNRGTSKPGAHFCLDPVPFRLALDPLQLADSGASDLSIIINSAKLCNHTAEGGLCSAGRRPPSGSSPASDPAVHGLPMGSRPCLIQNTRAHPVKRTHIGVRVCRYQFSASMGGSERISDHNMAWCADRQQTHHSRHCHPRASTARAGARPQGVKMAAHPPPSPRARRGPQGTRGVLPT